METAKKIVKGDVRAAARLIRDIDDMVPEAREVLKSLYPHTGKGYVIGVTGAPGVGKSTLVDKMIYHLRKAGKSIGVLAVDPTSPFSGGAVLGDRVRMQRHSLDQDVFMRSMATRGYFGGLTQSTRSAIDVLDAMGKEYIFVETVGVGQDEVDIVKNAHTTIIVLIPGMGDDIQTLKAGILEAGDIFVVNKADKEGADMTVNDLNWMLQMDEKRYSDGWKPPILKSQAASDKGIKEILDEAERHRRYMMEDPEKRHKYERQKAKDDLIRMIKERLVNEIVDKIALSGEFEKALRSVIKKETDPYTVTDNIVSESLKRPNG